MVNESNRLDDTKERLLAEGVDEDKLDRVLEAIEHEIDDIIEEYDLTIDDRDEVVVAVQHEMLEQVLALGVRHGMTALNQFEVLADDFLGDGSEQSARSNVKFTVGAVYEMGNAPKGVRTLSNVLLADEYGPDDA